MIKRISLLIFILSLYAVAFAVESKYVLDITQEGLSNEYFDIRNEGDGQVFRKEIDGKKIVSINLYSLPYSFYVYVNINNKIVFNTDKDVWVGIEYYSSGAGLIDLEYDSNWSSYTLSGAYTPVKETCLYSNSRLTFNKHVFHLPSAKLADRENYVSDFRLSGKVIISKLELFLDKPEELLNKQQEQESVIDTDMINFDKDKKMQLVFGGMDILIMSTRNEDATPAQIDYEIYKLDRTLPVLKGLGQTGKETYLRWRSIEYKKGSLDFSYFDREVELYKKHDVKWVPIIIMGPPYSLPDWYFKSPEHAGFVCIEHNRESHVESIWNPALPKHVDKFIKDFADKYKDSGVLESMLIGITGNYGESIYPVVDGNTDWTNLMFGPYHSHQGYWMCDKYAIESFREYAKNKYKGDVGALNRAWGSVFMYFDEIKPAEHLDMPSETAWLDQMEWYRESMNKWIDYWLMLTRKYMGPDTDIYLCNGGEGFTEHGSNFGQQTKIAAKYRAGVRITNEADEFARNFAMTIWVATAGRFYNANFGFEPWGLITSRGVAARLYNAITSGSKHLHFYVDNLLKFDIDGAWLKYGSELKYRDTKHDVLLLYPEVQLTVTNSVNQFLDKIGQLRDYTNIDLADEKMVADGILDKYKSLVIVDDDELPKETIDIITAWCKEKNGLVISNLKLKLDKAFVDKNKIKKGKTTIEKIGSGMVVTYKTANLADYYKIVYKILSGNDDVVKLTAPVIDDIDGEPDKIYAAITANNEILYFNDNNTEAQKKYMLNGKQETVPLAGYSIKSIK
jgi:hypothetical protein